MTPQQLIEKIKSGSFSDAVKSQIETLLANAQEITQELESKVKDILQAEIDKKFQEIGIDDSDPEIKQVHNTLDQDLAQVDKELEEDMQFVESNLQELEGMQKEVARAEESQQIEDLKSSLTS